MHSIIKRLLATALFAGLLLAGASLAQPPVPKEGPANGIAPAAPLGVDDVIERIMVFDKNKNGKVTKDELPDRMHHLIEQGDSNKDGALEKDEIRTLATRVAASRGGFGGGQVRVRGPGPAPGPLAGFRVADAVRFGPPSLMEGVVEDLKLSGEKKGKALAAVKAHQENMRKLMEQARAELLEKMKQILSKEELEDFRAALDRPRGETFITVGPRDTVRGGAQQKLDPPPK